MQIARRIAFLGDSPVRLGRRADLAGRFSPDQTGPPFSFAISTIRARHLTAMQTLSPPNKPTAARRLFPSLQGSCHRQSLSFWRAGRVAASRNYGLAMLQFAFERSEMAARGDFVHVTKSISFTGSPPLPPAGPGRLVAVSRHSSKRPTV
jgi:hypothetical protein